jgi:uncharacterized membrane protein
MTLGSVHLMVIGLRGHDDDFKGKVPQAFRAAHALHAERRHGDVRVLDMLLVRKDADGNIEQIRIDKLGEQERAFAGAVAGSLLGLPTARMARAKPKELYGALATAQRQFGLGEADLREITRDIPNGNAAAIVLVEHLWAIRVKDAVDDAGCTLLAEGLVSSAMLDALSADVASAQQSAERGRAHR